MIVAGSIDVIDLEHNDYQRCIALIDTYDDLGLAGRILAAAVCRQRLQILGSKSP